VAKTLGFIFGQSQTTSFQLPLQTFYKLLANVRRDLSDQGPGRKRSFTREGTDSSRRDAPRHKLIQPAGRFLDLTREVTQQLFGAIIGTVAVVAFPVSLSL